MGVVPNFEEYKTPPVSSLGSSVLSPRSRCTAQSRCHAGR